MATVAMAAALALTACSSTMSAVPGNAPSLSVTAQPTATTAPPSAAPSSAPPPATAPALPEAPIVPAAPAVPTTDSGVDPAAPDDGTDPNSGGDAGTSCSITTDSGNCYKDGEFCKKADRGLSTTDADGRSITCVEESGSLHWKYS